MPIKMRILAVLCVALLLCVGVLSARFGRFWYEQRQRVLDLESNLGAVTAAGREAEASYERLAGRLGSIATGAGAALARADAIADRGARLRERLKVYEDIYQELIKIAEELEARGPDR